MSSSKKAKIRLTNKLSTGKHLNIHTLYLLTAEAEGLSVNSTLYEER